MVDLSDAGSVRPPPRRAHAAVVFADIVGYTILMGADGAHTHARWMQLLHGTLRPMGARLGSTLMKSTGDGVAAAFPTVAAALCWAQAVQQAVRESDDPGVPPVAFRIGIDAGPVEFDADEIYGVAVNVAARLQEHAPPGGIALSAAVLAALPHPPPMLALGCVALRNIPTPVEAAVIEPPSPVRVPLRPPARGLPAIAIMPLANDANDPEDAYFAEGVLEDVAVSLGALRELAVIARSATLGWSPRRHDARTLGRMLGARYVLTGRLRRRPGCLRLDLDLHEAEDGARLWSERFDAPDSGIFAMQEAIAARIAAGLVPGIEAAELARALRQRPESLTAYDLTLRAMHAMTALEPASFADAGRDLMQAIAADPTFAMPLARAAQWHSMALGQGWSAAPDAAVAEVEDKAARAIMLDPSNALGHAMAGRYWSYHRRDPLRALPHFDRALAANPSHAMAWTWRAAALAFLGRGPEAVDSAERGLALSPRGRECYYFRYALGLALWAQGDNQQAARWLGRTLRERPGFSAACRVLIGALVPMGRLSEARRVAQRMLRAEPDFSLADFERRRAAIVDPALRHRLHAAMQSAGLPA